MFSLILFVKYKWYLYEMHVGTMYAPSIDNLGTFFNSYFASRIVPLIAELNDRSIDTLIYKEFTIYTYFPINMFRHSTNFITLVPSLTFTELWVVSMHGAFATGVACQQGTLTIPKHVPSKFACAQLLRPGFSNLSCLYSTFQLEYPLVLSRFCLDSIDLVKAVAILPISS